tara:strand:+ start:1491 stop:1664 length:174 start_codon:yes stop_codon:yes gene_type:complete
MKEQTTFSLIEKYNKIFSEWKESNKVINLSEFESIIIELTKREFIDELKDGVGVEQF